MLRLYKPYVSGMELAYIQEAIQKGGLSSGGFFTQECETFLENQLAVKKVLLTTSCTHALEMAALLLNINPGDEFIVSPFTFVSTVNAFVLRGGIPCFVDIRPDTLNINELLIENKVSSKTKAIIPVHYAGVGCEMDVISDISKHFQIPVIEDNAHGLFGRYKGKFLGTIGSMGTQSFHETKNIQCGEGGALLVNDETLIERAVIIRDKGTNRQNFLDGKVDSYTWVDIGSSFGLSEIQAAFLYAQLQSFGLIQKKRKQLWFTYMDSLSGWANRNDVKLPFIPANCESTYHIFYMILPTIRHRQDMINYLNDLGINGSSHFTPLHLSKMSQRLGVLDQCPLTEYICGRLIRLPIFNDLTFEQQRYIIENICRFQI